MAPPGPLSTSLSENSVPVMERLPLAWLIPPPLAGESLLETSPLVIERAPLLEMPPPLPPASLRTTKESDIATVVAAAAWTPPPFRAVASPLVIVSPSEKVTEPPSTSKTPLDAAAVDGHRPVRVDLQALGAGRDVEVAVEVAVLVRAG